VTGAIAEPLPRTSRNRRDCAPRDGSIVPRRVRSYQSACGSRTGRRASCEGPGGPPGHRGSWTAFEAHTAHTAARKSSGAGGALGGVALEALAEAAFAMGRVDECIEARERAYARFDKEGDALAAGRCAVWLCQAYFSTARPAIGGAWLQRALHALAGREDCAPFGLLLVVQAFGAMAAGELDVPAEQAHRALELGRRLRDPDVQALALQVNRQRPGRSRSGGGGPGSLRRIDVVRHRGSSESVRSRRGVLQYDRNLRRPRRPVSGRRVDCSPHPLDGFAPHRRVPLGAGYTGRGCSSGKARGPRPRRRLAGRASTSRP